MYGFIDRLVRAEITGFRNGRTGFTRIYRAPIVNNSPQNVVFLSDATPGTALDDFRISV